MPQKTKNMFSRRKTAEPIYDMKTMPGRFTYELVSEMGKPGNAEASHFREPKAGERNDLYDFLQKSYP